MTMKKEGRLALVCCLVFLCPCVKATEELAHISHSVGF
ncbi:hypothetical protein ES703_24110 [subsurface metagenome]